MTTDTKTNIIQTAGTLFAERGGDAVTVRDIAKSANVNVAAISYHFGGKDELYRACLFYDVSKVKEQYPFPTVADGADGEELLEIFIDRAVGRITSKDVDGQPNWQRHLILRELENHKAPYFKDVFDILVADDMAALTGIIMRINPDLEVLSSTQLHQMTYSVMGQIIFYYVTQGVPKHVTPQLLENETGRRAIINHITTFCTAAIRHYPVGKKVPL